MILPDTSSPYFNPEMETLSKEGLRALQGERLQQTVRRCMQNDFYRERFAALGINPDDITEEVAIHLRQIQKAVRKADTNAYNSIMRTAGILKDEAQPTGNTFNLNLTLGSQEALDGLRVALQNGAQPAPPEE